MFFEDTKALQITEMFGHSCLGCITPPYCQLSSVYHESTLYLAVAVHLVAGVLLATGIDAEEDEEEEGEAPERRAPVTEEG